MQSYQASSTGPSRLTRNVGVKELFLGFLKIGLMGFGGVGPVSRHVIVEDRRWLSEQEYASVLGIGQILPGANTVNAAVMIGDRFRGIRGALASAAGLMAIPILILVILASAYAHFAASPHIQAAIAGSAAASAGLVIGTAIKMARRLKPTRVALMFGLLAFACVGLLQFPLVPVVVTLAVLSIGLAFSRRLA